MQDKKEISKLSTVNSSTTTEDQSLLPPSTG